MDSSESVTSVYVTMETSPAASRPHDVITVCFLPSQLVKRVLSSISGDGDGLTSATGSVHGEQSQRGGEQLQDGHVW